MQTFWKFSVWLAVAVQWPRWRLPCMARTPGRTGGRGGGASWVAAPDAPAREYGVYHFRRTFELERKPAAFVVNVSADNRYKLYVNGEEAAVGPARGDLRNWRYDPVDIARFLRAGRNTLAAVVWNFAEMARWRRFRAGPASWWRARRRRSASPTPVRTGSACATGRTRRFPFARFSIRLLRGGPGDRVDASLYPWGWEKPEFDDAAWKPAVAIGRPALRGTAVEEDWWLVPRSIPMVELQPERGGAVRRSTGATPPASFLERPRRSPFRRIPRR